MMAALLSKKLFLSVSHKKDRLFCDAKGVSYILSRIFKRFLPRYNRKIFYALRTQIFFGRDLVRDQGIPEEVNGK